MKLLFTHFLLLVSIIAHSQTVAVDVISEQTESGYIIKAVNNTDVPREFTVTLDTHNLSGYTNPVKAVIPPQTTRQIAELKKVPNEYVNLKWKFSHKAIPFKRTPQPKADNSRESILSKLKVTEKDIVVFIKDDCDICDVVTSYLNENKVTFKQINVSKNPDSHRFMWDLVKLENPKAQKVSIPVFLVKGKLSYNETDIKGFVQGIKN